MTDDAPAGNESHPHADGTVLVPVSPDPVLVGAVDLHVHGYPDVGLEWQMRTDDLTMVRIARAYGLRGIVLKSHFWPTMDRALILNDQLAAPDFEVVASITLNHLVGGVSPMSVEAAALHGAKVVFMPTWGSRNDHQRGGVVRRDIIDRRLPSFTGHLDRGALTILDGNGRLIPEARDVLAIAKDLSLVVSTGHVSVEESLALAGEASDIGYDKVIFGHPFSRSIGADRTQIQEMADRGALIEMTYTVTALANSPVRVRDVYDVVATLGAEHIVLTSDVFFPWQPPQAETLRMFAGQLREYGCSDEDLRTMLVTNPARLLGLDGGGAT